MYISMVMVILTIFIYLTTFAESDKQKIKIFKEHYRDILFSGKGNTGKTSLEDIGTGQNPLNALINRMRSKGINKKLMDEFLTLNEIRDLSVVGGKRGVSVTLPEVVAFEPGKNELTVKMMQYLDSLVYLASELPYLVEVKGYSTGNVPHGYTDALEFSAKRAHTVYAYFLGKGIAGGKMKVSGCGIAFKDSSVAQDKVEITFKSPEL